MKNLGDLYAQSQKDLSHLPDFTLDVSLIFMKVLGLTRAQLITRSHMQVQERDRIKIEEMVKRRALCEPIAYIIGSKFFMGLEFYVDKQVLIPRGDTEILCENALELLKKQEFQRKNTKSSDVDIQDLNIQDIDVQNVNNPTSNKSGAKDLRGLEIGIGSGAISISLLAYQKNLLMDAVDLSEGALQIAKRNAQFHQVEDRLYLMQADALNSKFYEFLNSWESLKGTKYDFVISNPPYINEADKKDLMKDVVEYEPHMALFAQEEGLAFYRAILFHADQILKEDGFLAFEIGYDQASAVKKMAQERGFQKIQVIRDYEGHDRVVLAQR